MIKVAPVLAALLVAGWLCAAGAAPRFGPGSPDVAAVEGLPPIGKWMITPDFEPAHWLGELYRSRRLREPINVIVIDEVARTPEEARARFLEAATRAGFPSRRGHSSGYWGWIGDAMYPQFPDTPSHALSDEPFELDNNHGRFFGPHAQAGRFIFVGALSRESVAPLSDPKHQYVSFNRARDRFADALDDKTGFSRNGFVNLGNALVDSAGLTTGDHDGMAAVLLARKRR